MKTRKWNVQKATKWLKHVHHWQHSGLKQAEYCRKQGLKQYTLGYWIRKAEAKPGKGEFVEVNPATNSGRMPTGFRFELELPGGVQLRMTGADAETLKTVLRCVRESVC